jgi:hypothetical protein
MIKKAFIKKSAILISLVLSSSFLAANQPTSPFEKYDPNKKIMDNKGTATEMQNGMLSPDQEMQIRDMIMQEFQMKDGMIKQKKESGLMALDNDEILYLGNAESLKGTVEGKYLIFNTTTNMFRYVDMGKYKKVVSKEAAQGILEKEELQKQTEGKITQ